MATLVVPAPLPVSANAGVAMIVMLWPAFGLALVVMVAVWASL